jgi:hypothetical protein
MKHMLVATGVLGFVSAAASSAPAQEDLEKVAGWNGEWSLELWGRDSKGGEEWTTKGVGEQHQIGDFCVWNGKWTAPDGKGMSYVGITGYDPAKKEYFGVGCRSDGSRETSVITFRDKSMIVDGTNTMATGETVRVRCTWPVPPKDEYEGKCETFTDGEWWVSGTEKGIRVK